MYEAKLAIYNNKLLYTVFLISFFFFYLDDISNNFSVGTQFLQTVIILFKLLLAFPLSHFCPAYY